MAELSMTEIPELTERPELPESSLTMLNVTDCVTVPCLNGGICIPDPNSGKFVCECPPLLRGDRCQIIPSKTNFKHVFNQYK